MSTIIVAPNIAGAIAATTGSQSNQLLSLEVQQNLETLKGITIGTLAVLALIIAIWKG